ncbi:hypothetical protein AB0M48_38595 [Lentzea sp. NPDC051208]|uniref:hypothetical protein n=1 Tax=Lentzea sp. NPDC051208 TaxID=3154642 RepID=UPI0034365AAE
MATWSGEQHLGWSEHHVTRLETAAAGAVSLLQQRGMTAEWHWLRAPEPAGAPVLSLQVLIGPAFRHPGYSVYGFFQVADPAYPNLGTFRTLEVRDYDQMPVADPARPVYDKETDRRVSAVLTPVLNSLLNPLDPCGRGQSLTVGCFHGRVSARDLLNACVMGCRIVRGFRREGQLAIIWVDFSDKVFVLAARAFGGLGARFGVHLLVRDTLLSTRATAVRLGGHDHHVGGLSHAFDRGVQLAHRVLAHAAARSKTTAPPAGSRRRQAR